MEMKKKFLKIIFLLTEFWQEYLSENLTCFNLELWNESPLTFSKYVFLAWKIGILFQ